MNKNKFKIIKYFIELNIIFLCLFFLLLNCFNFDNNYNEDSIDYYNQQIIENDSENNLNITSINTGYTKYDGYSNDLLDEDNKVQNIIIGYSNIVDSNYSYSIYDYDMLNYQDDEYLDQPIITGEIDSSNKILEKENYFNLSDENEVVISLPTDDGILLNPGEKYLLKISNLNDEDEFFYETFDYNDWLDEFYGYLVEIEDEEKNNDSASFEFSWEKSHWNNKNSGNYIEFTLKENNTILGNREYEYKLNEAENCGSKEFTINNLKPNTQYNLSWKVFDFNGKEIKYQNGDIAEENHNVNFNTDYNETKFNSSIEVIEQSYDSFEFNYIWSGNSSKYNQVDNVDLNFFENSNNNKEPKFTIHLNLNIIENNNNAYGKKNIKVSNSKDGIKIKVDDQKIYNSDYDGIYLAYGETYNIEEELHWTDESCSEFDNLPTSTLDGNEKINLKFKYTNNFTSNIKLKEVIEGDSQDIEINYSYKYSNEDVNDYLDIESISINVYEYKSLDTNNLSFDDLYNIDPVLTIPIEDICSCTSIQTKTDNLTNWYSDIKYGYSYLFIEDIKYIQDEASYLEVKDNGKINLSAIYNVDPSNINLHIPQIKKIQLSTSNPIISAEISETHGGQFFIDFTISDIYDFEYYKDDYFGIGFFNLSDDETTELNNEIYYYPPNNEKPQSLVSGNMIIDKNIIINELLDDDEINCHSSDQNLIEFRMEFSGIPPTNDEMEVVLYSEDYREIDSDRTAYDYTTSYSIDPNSLTPIDFTEFGGKYIYSLSLDVYNPNHLNVDFSNDISFIQKDNSNKNINDLQEVNYKYADGIKVLNYDDDKDLIDKLNEDYNSKNLYIEIDPEIYSNSEELSNGDISFLIKNDIYIGVNNSYSEDQVTIEELLPSTSIYKIESVNEFYVFPWWTIYSSLILVYLILFFYLIWLIWYKNKNRRYEKTKKLSFAYFDDYLNQHSTFGWNPKLNDYIRINNMDDKELNMYAKEINIKLFKDMTREEKVDLLSLLTSEELSKVKEFVNMEIEINNINKKEYTDEFLNEPKIDKWMKRIIWNSQIEKLNEENKKIDYKEMDLITKYSHLFKNKIHELKRKFNKNNIEEIKDINIDDDSKIDVQNAINDFVKVEKTKEINLIYDSNDEKEFEND